MNNLSNEKENADKTCIKKVNELKIENYYTDMQSKMMKNFDTMFACTKKIANRYLDSFQLESLYKQAKKEFENLIPTIPYIGGEKVSGTKNLVGGVQMLAIIRGLENEGLSQREIGEIIYGTFVELFHRIPKIMGYLLGKLMWSKRFLKHQKKNLLELQKRRYPEAFVSEYVSCSDGSFDYGQDTLECAICKFYQKHGAIQYLPYICLGDYPLYERLGFCFCRTKTLENGDEVCDFRFKKKGHIVTGWPPETLPEWHIREIADEITSKPSE
jgi:hypothetical protein